VNRLPLSRTLELVTDHVDARGGPAIATVVLLIAAAVVVAVLRWLP
jgi:hypothetical protein